MGAKYIESKEASKNSILREYFMQSETFWILNVKEPLYQSHLLVFTPLFSSLLLSLSVLYNSSCFLLKESSTDKIFEARKCSAEETPLSEDCNLIGMYNNCMCQFFLNYMHCFLLYRPLMKSDSFSPERSVQ